MRRTRRVDGLELGQTSINQITSVQLVILVVCLGFFFFLSQQINHCDLFLRFTLISFKTIPIVLYLCPEARGADGYLQQQQRSRLRGQKQQRVVCKVADGGTMRGRIRDRNQGGETHPAWRLRSNTGQTVLL